MLIKVTDFCSRGCSHCMEDSTPKGTHMTEDVFRRALACARRVENLAWSMGIPPFILLSGGECSEHPEIIKFIEIVYEEGMFVTLISNGQWLHNRDLRESILRPEWPFMNCQITFDPRFYPEPAPPVIDDKRLFYRPPTEHLVTLGRAGRKRNFANKHNLPSKQAPGSFNFRSMCRSFNSIEKAVWMLRSRSVQGLSGACTPSITCEGDFVAGESKFCGRVGTVDSSNDELTRNTVNLRCNNCGLVSNLDDRHKAAIGELPIYLGAGDREVT